MKTLEILEFERLKRLNWLDNYRSEEKQSYVWKFYQIVKEELKDIQLAIEILKRESEKMNIKEKEIIIKIQTNKMPIWMSGKVDDIELENLIKVLKTMQSNRIEQKNQRIKIKEDEEGKGKKIKVKEGWQ